MCALVASGIGDGVGQRDCAVGQRAVGRKRARGSVVGGGYFHTIDVQRWRAPGGDRADQDARRGVVGGGGGAVGAFYGRDIVDVTIGGGWCPRGRAGDGERQCAAGSAFVTSSVREGVGQCCGAVGQRVAGRERSRGGVVACGHLHAVDIQLWCIAEVGPHVDARRCVISGCCRAVGAL